jgi:hypothetical protein
MQRLSSVTFEDKSKLRAIGVHAFESCACSGGVEFPVSLRVGGDEPTE